jgi:hypothetical protein
MTTLLREGMSPGVQHYVRRRRSVPTPPLRLGLIRIRLRCRGDGFSWDQRERWILWGLVVLVRYPGPAKRRGRWMFKPACPEAGTGARLAYVGHA